MAVNNVTVFAKMFLGWKPPPQNINDIKNNELKIVKTTTASDNDDVLNRRGEEINKNNFTYVLL